MIYYVLDGLVEVENVSYNGKKLVIEKVQENTFIGFISDMHKVDLQSSGLAVTPVKALMFSEAMMEKLMDNDKFSIFFYQETSSRIFKMYKTVLAKVLFSPDEIMAYYILDNADNGMFSLKSSYSLCENIGISRRGIYNILYRFEELNCIRKVESSVYKVTDRHGLVNRAEHMISFMAGSAGN